MLALLCGGQGLLAARMFDLAATRAEAAAVFAAAAVLLGRDPRDLVHDGDADLLAVNRTSQILSVTAVLATHACIRDALPEPVALAGYSVGEMAAWSIAGIWPAETALRLTTIRAEAMDEAGGTGGHLGYVRGLRRSILETLVAHHGCAIAITNPDGLFVVGGSEPDVAALCGAAVTAGATRAGLFSVKTASHTTRLTAAVAPIHAALAAATSSGPISGRVLLSGGDGERILVAADATARLAAQVATPIDWAATLEALGEAGADRILDLGPGHALADMARTALPTARSYAADAFHSIDGLRNWIASA